jgi:hypothetical protein
LGDWAKAPVEAARVRPRAMMILFIVVFLCVCG